MDQYYYLFLLLVTVFGYGVISAENTPNETLNHSTTEHPLMREEGITPFILTELRSRNSSSTEDGFAFAITTSIVESVSSRSPITSNAVDNDSGLPLHDNGNPEISDSQRNGNHSKAESHQTTVAGEISTYARILQKQNNSSVVNGANSSSSSSAERDSSLQDEDLLLSSAVMQYSHDTTQTINLMSGGLDDKTVTLNPSQTDSNDLFGVIESASERITHSLFPTTALIISETSAVSSALEFNTTSLESIDSIRLNATEGFTIPTTTVKLESIGIDELRTVSPAEYISDSYRQATHVSTESTVKATENETLLTETTSSARKSEPLSLVESNLTSSRPPREQQTISDDVKTTASPWLQEQSETTSIDVFELSSPLFTRESEIILTTDSHITLTDEKNDFSDGEITSRPFSDETPYSSTLTILSTQKESIKITASETTLIFLPTQEPQTETDFTVDSVAVASNSSRQQTSSLPVSSLPETNVTFTFLKSTEIPQTSESESMDSDTLIMETVASTTAGLGVDSSEPANETIRIVTVKKTDTSSSEIDIPYSTLSSVYNLTSALPTMNLINTTTEQRTSMKGITDETTRSFETVSPQLSSSTQATRTEIGKIVTQSLTGLETSRLTSGHTLQTIGMEPQTSSFVKEHTSSTGEASTTDRSEAEMQSVMHSPTATTYFTDSQTFSREIRTTASSVIITSLWTPTSSVKVQTSTTEVETRVSPERTTPLHLETDSSHLRATTPFTTSTDTARQSESPTRETVASYASPVAEKTESDVMTEQVESTSRVTDPHSKPTTLETRATSSSEVITSTDVEQPSVMETFSTTESSDYAPLSYTEISTTAYHEIFENFTKYPELSNVSNKELDDLTAQEQENIITVVFRAPDVQRANQMSRYVFPFCKWLLRIIIEGTKNNTGLLHDTTNQEKIYANFTPSDVIFVAPSPFIYGEELIFSFFVRDYSSNDIIAVDIILPLLEYNAEALQNMLNLNVSYFLRGPYIFPDTDDIEEMNVLEQYGLLIAAVGLVTLVILLVLITAVIYLRCKARRSVHCITDKVQLHPDLQAIPELGDLTPAAEILREEMAEKGSFVNGSHVFTIGDDEGWLVPIGDVPVEDYNAPDVQDTKL